MLLFSNLKSTFLKVIFILIILIIHHTNNIVTNRSKYSNVLDLPAQIEYYENGQLYMQICYKNDNLYREGDLLADIYYYENGQPWVEIWYKNDELHREESSAIIEYYNLPEKVGIII